MSAKPLTVTVDPALCIGSGLCAGLDPEHFRLDGTSAVVTDDDFDDPADAQSVADCCPSGAIQIAGEG